MGLTLRPHQAEMVPRVAASPASLCHDEMGVGKTALHIVAAATAGAEQNLVICPASMMIAWSREVAQWDKRGLPVRVVRHVEDVGPGWNIVSYDFATKNRVCLLRSWDLLILDEYHLLKSRKSRRTMSVYGAGMDRLGGIAGYAKRIWCLSGTPCPNNYAEIWTTLHAIVPHVIIDPKTKHPLDEWGFKSLFCTLERSRFGWRVVGNKNADLLHQMLKAVSFRRMKSILKDLPPLTITTYPLELSDDEQAAFLAMEDELADVVREAGDDDDLLVQLLTERELSLSTVRRRLGAMKVRASLQVALDFLNGTDSRKLVIFTIHRDVLDALRAGLYEAGFGHVPVIDGRISITARQKSVDDFQAVDGPRVILVQSQAGGLGITLNRASDCLIVEPDWVPSTNAQAISRLHRMGQSAGVLARFLYVPGSLDARIMDTFHRKAGDLAEVFNR